MVRFLRDFAVEDRVAGECRLTYQLEHAMNTFARLRKPLSTFALIAGLSLIGTRSIRAGAVYDNTETNVAARLEELKQGLYKGVSPSRGSDGTLTSGLRDEASRAQTSPVSRGVFDIDVSNGLFTNNGVATSSTIGNLVKRLRDTNPNWTLVVAPDANEFRLGELTLRNVDLVAFGQVIELASDGALQAARIFSGENVTIGWGISAGDSRSGAGAGSGRMVEAFNVSGFAQFVVASEVDKNIDPNARIGQIVTAIEETITSLNARGTAAGNSPRGQAGSAGARGSAQTRQPPSIRYYQSANLLVVIGSASDIDVATRIIDALPGQQGQRDRRPGVGPNGLGGGGIGGGNNGGLGGGMMGGGFGGGFNGNPGGGPNANPGGGGGISGGVPNDGSPTAAFLQGLLNGAAQRGGGGAGGGGGR